MQIDIIFYTDEKMTVKNVIAVDFDSEKSALTILNEDNTTTTYGLVKNIQVF